MRIGPSIQDHRLAGAAGFLHPVHEVALMVRLAKMQNDPAWFAERGKTSLDVRESRKAIGIRFPRAEKIEVRPIQDVNGFHGGPGPRKCALRFHSRDQNAREARALLPGRHLSALTQAALKTN